MKRPMVQTACRPRSAIPALLVAVALTLACCSPISKSVRRELDQDIPFRQLQEQPATFEGKRVLLGGEIIQTRNRQEGTTIEVLQRRLNRWGRPRVEDDTEGRFLVFTERFLDPAVYSQGRRITVAGIVLGGHTEKIGEVDYLYPLLHAREIHLWQDPSSQVLVYPYPVWYYWDLDGGAPW